MREQEARRARLKGRLALGLGLLVLLMLIGMASLPAYRALKRWRADQLMSEAEKSVERGSLVEAYQSARSAHGLDPNNLRALRMLAEMYEGTGAREALAYRRSVAESAGATGQDRAAYLRVLIRAGRLDLADEFVRKMGVTGRADPVVAALIADLLRMRGQPEEARAVEDLAAASSVLGEKTTAELIQARGRLESPDPAERAQARTTLLRIGASKVPEARDALRILAAAPDRTEKETREIIRLLEANPLNPAADFFLAKTLTLELRPDWRGAVLEEARKLWSGGTEEQRTALAEFLMRHGDAQGVLDLPVTRRGRAFLLRLDALARLGRWPTIREELVLASAEKNALDPFFIEVFQARVAQEMREISMADVRWKQAMSKAAGNPQKLEFLANFAEKSGNLPMAAEAYRSMVKFPAAAVPGYLGLIRVAEKRADMRQLRDVIGELSRQLPEDPAPKNDLAYLNLLFNERIDDSLQISRDLVSALPDRAAYRTTLALAYLRKNESQKALAAYEETKIDWSAALPGWQAVRAAVLAANGREEEARRLAASINWDRLKPQERDLVRTLRAPRS
jgi:tetratricopeptide (TPR) repeat protein